MKILKYTIIKTQSLEEKELRKKFLEDRKIGLESKIYDLENENRKLKNRKLYKEQKQMIDRLIFKNNVYEKILKLTN